jgi:hypothetical protein
MSLLDKLINEVCYFSIDISKLPFAKLDLNFDKKVAYARVINPEIYLGFSGPLLAGVYDYFTDKVDKNLDEIKSHDFFFNQVQTFRPRVRGFCKWTFIGSQAMSTLNIPQDLPHMGIGRMDKNEDDIVTYYKNGVYAPGMGDNFYSKTQFKNVKHLEGTTFVSQWELLLIICAELIHRSWREFTDEQLSEKLMLLIEPEAWNQFDEREKSVAIKDFIYYCRRTPYCDIPKRYREKAINEVDALNA